MSKDMDTNSITSKITKYNIVEFLFLLTQYMLKTPGSQILSGGISFKVLALKCLSVSKTCLYDTFEQNYSKRLRIYVEQEDPSPVCEAA